MILPNFQIVIKWFPQHVKCSLSNFDRFLFSLNKSCIKIIFVMLVQFFIRQEYYLNKSYSIYN